MKKNTVGITIVGKDREGIVAGFTSFVFEMGGNIERLSQNVMEGLFGMYLEVSLAKNVDIAWFDSEIQVLAKKYRMEVSVHHEVNTKKQIAVFVTKEPLCLQTLISARRRLKGEIAVIVGTEDTLSGMARKARIPFVLVKDRDQKKAEQKLLDICKKYDIDVIVLARYMRIMSPNFVWRYPNRIINIHPSLLPAFPGASAYAQAYERGTKVIGVTSHYVTENLDQGPIIFQDSFKVSPEENLDRIKARGQILEAKTLLKALKMHLDGRLDVRWRKVHVR